LGTLYKQAHFVFLGWKGKYIANTNLFVKQADSIAAKGSCIFLGVLLRDYFGSRHAVKIEIRKYVTLCSHLLVGVVFLK
jgi:hypothetical protein